MKKTIISVALLVVAIISSSVVNAQILERNDMIYNSSILPQSNRYNPAIFQKNRNAYISLPNVGLSVGLPVAYSDFDFEPVAGTDKYKLNIYSMADQLRNDKSINLGTDIDLIGFGFHVNRFIFTFNASASVTASLFFPDGLASTISDGLINMYKEPASVAFNDFVNVSAYERFAIGVGYDITDNFTLGARVNVLNGIMSASLSDVEINLSSLDDAYSDIDARVNYRMMRAGMLSMDFETGDNEFKHSFSNIGFTFDLGAVYSVNNWIFSASVVDFGPGITYKENVRLITPKYKEFHYSGSDMGDFINGGTMDADFFNGVADTLGELVKYHDSIMTENYSQSIPTKVFLGASYKFNDIIRANLLFHGEWDRGMLYNGEDGVLFMNNDSHFRYNTSISASVKAGNWLEFMVANAFCFDGEKGSLFNPGVGLTIAPGNAFQLYIMADYISSFKAVDIKGTTLQFGMNICFGHNRTKDVEQKADSTPLIF